MTFNYYNRQGQIIDRNEWVNSYDVPGAKHIAETILADGKWISTVWLGPDHQFGDGPPLIFETMVFPSREDFHELDCQRYSTEEQAMAGHAAMVEKWQKEGEK